MSCLVCGETQLPCTCVIQAIASAFREIERTREERIVSDRLLASCDPEEPS